MHEELITRFFEETKADAKDHENKFISVKIQFKREEEDNYHEVGICESFDYAIKEDTLFISEFKEDTNSTDRYVFDTKEIESMTDNY